MNKTKRFQKAIRENRRVLRAAGYAASVINSWEYGIKRKDGSYKPVYPKMETAVQLSHLLNIPLRDIPKYQTIRE